MEGAAASSAPRRAPLILRIESLRMFMLWLTVFSSFLVLIEPAPYDLLAVLTLGLFVLTGAKWSRTLNPLAVFLFLYHLGAAICLIQVLHLDRTLVWTIVGIFLAITALFLAMVVQERTAERVTLIYKAWVLSAVVASLIGILSYFRLFPSADTFLIYGGRVKSTFKDPNVFGPFLVLPGLYLIQQLYARGLRAAPKVMISLGIIMVAMLLTFSRGAWAHFVFSAAIMTLLTFVVSRSSRERGRIIGFSLGGLLFSVVLLVVLLSIPAISHLLQERASLSQSYDVGEMGRFGRHILGFQLVLDRPFGIGMLQFHKYFGEDPHNTYLNGFLSYTWMGGIALLGLVFTTLALSFRLLFVPTPWQLPFICAFSTFVVVMAEAWIIDIDHWRHMYALLGLLWGMSAATIQWKRDYFANLAPH